MSALPPGLVIAAPRSSGGKTTVSLGLMRAFRRAGLTVQPFKNGPDYIDPAFHQAATGRASFNLDTWALGLPLLTTIAARAGDADLVLAEGSMGLFDGVAQPGRVGTGATADLAALFGWPVLLVLDVSGQAQSAGAVALGCKSFRSDVPFAGVILNKLGSERHRRLVEGAMMRAGLPVLGALSREDSLALPERHLGLVQAEETPALEEALERLAERVAAACDLGAIRAAARSAPLPSAARAVALPPPGQRIALARDAAFSFVYPHLLEDWRRAGAEILPFSPLADEAPDGSADVAWLPGGYPELHGGKLAGNRRFLEGLRRFAEAKPVHGECGGYMVLGQGLVDAAGERHALAGLLGLETDFSRRRLHLGYRRARLTADAPIGRAGDCLAGHEFHYARVVVTGNDQPLVEAEDAEGRAVAEAGSRRGHVSGTFFHLLAAWDEAAPRQHETALGERESE